MDRSTAIGVILSLSKGEKSKDVDLRVEALVLFGISHRR